MSVSHKNFPLLKLREGEVIVVMIVEKLLVEVKVLKVVRLAVIIGEENEVAHQGATAIIALMLLEAALFKKDLCANIRRQKEVNEKERKERKEDRDEFFSLFWFACKFSFRDSLC